MIRFDRVTKLYSGNTKPALNGVDVEIKAGEFVFLVGASGSGKSSFLRLVLKEDKPTSGEIHVLGQRLDRISSRKVPYFRRSLGVVFQDFRLLPGRTVYQNVAFTLQVIGKSRGFIQEAVPDVLKMVGLDGKAERLPHELSGGEQQRVAIARAVVNKPAILLADEPTGNLDPATSAGIMQVLELINAGGTTVVMATHDVSIVDSMKRRVIELVGGNIIRDEVEGGYTTSIPVQQQQPAAQTAPTTQSAPVITGAAAFAAAIAEEAGPVELPTSPRTVVEGSPNRYADLPDYDAYPMTAPIAVPTITGAIPRINAAPATHSVPAPAAPASPQPPAPLAPAAARAPLAPSEPAQTRRAARTAEVQRLQPRLHTPEPQPQAAPAAEAAVAPSQTEPSQPAQDPLRHLLAGRAQAPSHDQSPPAAAPNDEPEQHDDPLALAVRLGLRRPGAAPESTSSQEVGPTS